ncbi:MAG: NAD(P)/FAD-dependent oxidoreductase [Stomatobaculum sp.]|nr:NAD(P)/FAD-dependent oxidoreductase [Stomatobaculum sp.]
MKKVIVIGGGAAGMAAALAAARSGASAVLIEKNEKLGKKLFITGKGRCNLTNDADMKEVQEQVVSNPRFLFSAFQAFTNADIMRLVEDNGCPLKTERGGRVFPQSDHSWDVINALERALKKAGVRVRLNTAVKQLLMEPYDSGEEKQKQEQRIKGVLLSGEERLEADAVILATGGLSYPSTGSDGDGHRFAKEAGHRITETCPSLVPMNVKEHTAAELMGLSLRNVEIRILDGKKEKYREFGEMLFTHFGVSGPVILSASAVTGPLLRKKELKLSIDLKPALSAEQLDRRILRDFSAAQNKDLRNALTDLFPSRLIPEVLYQAGLDPAGKVRDLTKEERGRLVQATKALTFTLTGLRGFSEAIVTKGGVNVKEVDPSTMESKKVKGLYFAGELLDVDAMTGGFNLQIAWSTGYLAGKNAAGW